MAPMESKAPSLGVAQDPIGSMGLIYLPTSYHEFMVNVGIHGSHGDGNVVGDFLRDISSMPGM